MPENNFNNSSANNNQGNYNNGSNEVNNYNNRGYNDNYQNNNYNNRPSKKPFNWVKWVSIILLFTFLFLAVKSIWGFGGLGLGSNLQKAGEKTSSLIDANNAISECRNKLFDLDSKVEQYFLQSSSSRATLQSKFKIALQKDKSINEYTVNAYLARFQELSNVKPTTLPDTVTVPSVTGDGSDTINKSNEQFVKTTNKTAEQVLSINNSPLPANLIGELSKNLVGVQPIDQKLWDALYIDAGIEENKLLLIGKEMISLKNSFSKFYQDGKYYLPFNITGRDGDINLYKQLRCIPTLASGDMTEVKEYLDKTYRLSLTKETIKEKETGERDGTLF